MKTMTIVQLGGWDENYAFEKSEDAFKFWELVKKSIKVDTDFTKTYGYLAVEKKSTNKVTLTELPFCTKEEAEKINKDENEVTND